MERGRGKDSEEIDGDGGPQTGDAVSQQAEEEETRAEAVEGQLEGKGPIDSECLRDGKELLQHGDVREDAKRGMGHAGKR